MKKGFALLLLLATMSASYARQISEKEAIAVAEKFMAGESGLKAPMKSAPGKPGKAAIDNQSYYIFNADDDKGFVIVSGDDRARKILGYADKGHFDADNIPPQLSWLLGEYANQIATLPSSAPTDPSWTQTTASRATNEVLLETANWGQGAPYNALTPEFNGQHAPTGCVATAMAIVMKYHNWPPKGRGEHRYYDYGTENMSYYDFSNFVIDWSIISEESSLESDNAIANLMYAAGQAVDMMYSKNESGAFFPLVAPYLRYHFYYDTDCEYLQDEEYSKEEWETILCNEINNNRPVIYQGSGAGNHAFICDGYNNEHFFHFNWGWDGSANGFYALDALNPDGFNFSSDYSMIIGITPDKSNKNISPAFVDKGYAYEDCGIHTGSFISVENVEKDIPFSFNCRILTVPFGFSGEFGVAITDSKGGIREVLKSKPYDMPQNNTWPFDIMFEDCIPTYQPDASDYVQLVSKSDIEKEWLPVLGTSQTPTCLPVRGNNVKTAVINVSIDQTAGEIKILDKILESGTYTLLKGSKIILKGEQSAFCKVTHNGESNSYFWTNPKQYEIILGEGIYDINLQSGDLKDVSVSLETSGSLHTKIGLEEANFIKGLTLTGKINVKDLIFIRDNCGYLKNLNLQQTEIEEEIYNGIKYPANTLPTNSLSNLTDLKSLILPSNLISIGSNALSRTALIAIDIPVSVISIDNDAFSDDYSLKTVQIHWLTPNSCWEAFVNTGCYTKGNLHVPIGTKTLYENSPWNYFENIIEKESTDIDYIEFSSDGLVFHLFPYLETASIISFNSELSPNLIIPEDISYNGISYKVTNIEKNAFSNCKIIKSCAIPNTITSIGEYAFQSCEELKEVSFGSSLTELPDACFTSCYKLEKADIPQNIISLGWDTFGLCKSIKKIHIHKSLKLHSNGSYSNLSNCDEITLDAENPYYSLVNNILYSKDMKKLILCAGAIQGAIYIPEGVETLSWRAFNEMPNLTEIHLPSTIKDIGYQFVHSCPKLRHISIPDLVKGTDSETITDCNELESITLGRSFQGGQGIRGNGNLKYIFLRNKAKVNMASLFGGNNIENKPYKSYIFYTDQLYQNAYIDECKTFYVPGGSERHFDDIANCDISALWEYKIDKNNNLIKISPNIAEVIIEKITINGEVIGKNSNGLYPFKTSSDIEVIVDFILHGVQRMTTTYTSDFNTNIPSNDLLTEVPAESITLDKTEVTLEIDETVTLKATVLPESTTDKTIAWSSSDEDVATVSKDGVVTAVGIGETTVKASCGDASAECKIYVIPTPAESITLDKTEVTLEIDETVTLKATVLPESTTDKTITWSSSDEDVATVSNDGVVTAVGIGETTVKASCGDASAVCKISVVDISGIDSIIMSDKTYSIYNLNGVCLKASCTSDEISTLTAGIYIIRFEDGTTQKIVIK